MTSEHNNSTSESSVQSSGTSLIFVGLVVVVVAVFAYLFLQNDSPTVSVDEPTPITEPVVVEPVPEPEVEPTEPEAFEPIEPIAEPIDLVPTLPELDSSDDYVFNTLTELSFRKELTSLILTDDLIRRMVVFTDNFAKGDMAYSHLPLKTPHGHFSAVKVSTEGEDVYRLTEANVVRYQPYIELLNSFEPDTLVDNFIEVKPLFEQAYAELGYPNKNFNDVLQQAIDKVLDFKQPSNDPKLVRPSVIFEYQDPNIESLPETDKFLMRLGKENLLQLKAVSLTLNNKLKSVSEDR